MGADTPLLDRTLAIARVNWTPAHRQPSPVRLIAATIIAIVGALAADAILVAAGTRVFPGTAGYGHFQFHDYAKLTIIGALIGAIGWPVVTRVSSAPKWLYGRLTILISLVLFLPDAWLLIHHQPPKAVAVLMSMHVAVAAVIYCTMVNVAPVREVRGCPL
jgi:FtsH-binding integral membrane protein